jgi:lysophospholipase L1-like esterase
MKSMHWLWMMEIVFPLGLAIHLGAQTISDRKAFAEPKRFLALGDSYTIGEGVDSAASWPAQLARAMRAAKINLGDPLIVARTGWTTDELASGIAIAPIEPPYELVTLLIGVNNQYRGRSAEKYRAEFVSLLAQAIEFAGGMASRVVVVSIPDWGVTPFADGKDRAKIGAEIDRFNAINRDETKKAGARYADVTAISREMHDGWTVADGLHPSAAQYARWAAQIRDPATSALRQ